MTPVYHLSPEQRRAQELVAQFNADERRGDCRLSLGREGYAREKVKACPSR